MPQPDLNTVLLIISMVGYIFTYWYQLNRIKELEKSREDIKVISDQIKIYADMIKIDEIRKYFELEKSNLRTEYEKEIDILKARYEKNVKELEEEFSQLKKFKAHMIENVVDSESFFIGYHNLFKALPEERREELLKKYPDIIINWTAKKSS